MTAFTDGHQVELLEGGGTYFPALERAFDRALHEIHLQVYIFEDDEAGRAVTDALVRAAQRGVLVHVLIDGFGGRTMSLELRAKLLDGGVELLFFRPQVSLLDFQRSRLRRLHHKLACVDGLVGFVGGINVIHDMHTPGHTPPRWDYAVQVRGPITRDILRVARHTWERVAWTYLRERRGQWPQAYAAPAVPVAAGYIRAALLIRDTLRHRRDIEQAYLEAIGSAQHEVLIANAYFLPGVEFRHALIGAARRGVRVTLLLQARVEYVLMHHASRALYDQLLEAGIEIFEYHQSFMHAKVAVIDRRWSTVGSSNIDPLSLLLAREANVFVLDETFAGELHASLTRAMHEGARAVVRGRWRRGWAARAASWLSYWLVRVLLGWAGYGARKDYL